MVGEEIKGIFNRLKKRDFRGYTGLAVKNSIYVFSTNLIGKLGSFAFVIILARILMPELFGLYSLALATILLFAGFSESGISHTFTKFVSGELGKGRNGKARAYALYLLKIKLIFMFAVSIILLVSAKFISNLYYGKPIFFALIAGIFYIFFLGLISIFYYFFQSTNDFKTVFYKEAFFQIVRLIFVPLIVLYSLRYVFSTEVLVLIPILGLSFALFLTFLFLIPFAKKRMYFLKEKTKKLQKKEKKKIRKFIFQLFVLSFSGIVFAQIDLIFLGRFVLPRFIGFYAAAFGLIGALGPLIGFAAVFLPIFTRLKGKRLEKGFEKTIKITIILSSILFFLTILLAPFFIKTFYGQNYLTSISLLRLLSPLIISMPLISMYTVYFIARNKPKIVTKWLLISTVMNIVLNYVLIVWLINYGQMAAVFGVSIGTLFSRYFYLVTLIKSRK